MAAMVLLTRFLLGCLISDITYATALPTERGKTPESWPPLYWGPHPPAQTWGRPVVPTWQPPGGWNVPDRKPFLLQNPTAVKNTFPPQKPQKRFPVASPRTFQIQLQAPVSNAEDTSMGQDYSPSKGLSKFHLETQLESPSEVHSHTGSFHNPKGSSKSAFHLSLSVPVPTTTEAPGIKVITQKPPESKLVNFFSGLLGQKGQGNQNSQGQTQQNQMFFKPGAHQHPSTQSVSGSLSGHHHTPVQNVHHSPHWFPLANSDNADVSSILQSAKYVNGQLMIPLEKCPGLEQFLQNHHHHHQGHGHHHQGHGHHHHHQGHGHHHQGHGHHHHHQGHGHHHQGHGHHHHHRDHGHHHHHHQGHDHHHHHQGHGQTKPQNTKFFLNMEGSVPNPQEQWQGKENPFRSWHSCKSCGTPANPVSGGSQHSKTDKTSGQFFNPLAYASYAPDSQLSIMKPGQTNYMVQHGGNVEYDKQPDAQSHNHFQYVQQRKHF